MKVKQFVLASLLLFVAVPAIAVDMELLCPSSVTAGDNVTVTVANVQNWESFPMTLKRFAPVFVVNGENNLGSVAVYGPYSKVMTNTVVVPAGTDSCAPNGCIVPGTVPNFKVNLGPAPAVNENKLGMAMLSFITGNGQEIAAESCFVNIIAAPQ